MTAIALDAVGKTYAVQGDTVQALTPTTLDIAEGELVVLLGPSGCGKTTLLRLIAGLIEPSQGRISVGGRDLWQGSRRNAEAVQDFQKAIALAPGRIIHHFELARVYAATGLPQLAREEWEICARLSPIDADDADAQAEARQHLADGARSH